MIRLEKSQVLQRKIRQDDIADMAIPTWTFIRELIQRGRTEKALEFMEYEVTRNKVIHDLLVQFIQEIFTGIASFGEDEVEKLWRKILDPVMRHVIDRIRSMEAVSVEEILRLDAELQRCHYGEVKVVEEPDRYVMTCDPCGAGGRLRRERGLGVTKNSYTVHAWPWSWSIGVTKKAYPWSWGKTGVPYYCAHCSIMWEIIPTELLGYPIRIHLLGDRPEDPCVHLYYKKPELIPEEYFIRIGMTKTIE